jgi:cytochrome d ubiquinol oxidase subunit II
MDLNVFWFFMLGVLITGYAILDGFDLGVGTLHLFVRGDLEKRIVLNSIGPLWDGNEVWLVTFGGALFAAFPVAYASLLSGLYLPFMLLLVALIGRAISIEFRSKREWRLWRMYWDFSFFLSSTVVTFLFGVIAGNAIRGLPIDAQGHLVASLPELLTPYPIAVGLLAVATSAMHGAIYLHLKTEGELQRRTHRWMWTTFGLFLVGYLIVTIATLVAIPHATDTFRRWPSAWGVVGLNILAIANIPRAIYLDRPAYAFVSSCATIAALAFLFAMALFPSLAISNVDRAYDLTIYNAASSEKTLSIMQFVVLLGTPFVFTYTAIVYWVFRGKVKLDQMSY